MSDVPAWRKRKQYHHRNLRPALIDAAREIVETEGLEALSLRAVARRANVSHNAPYYHFSDKSQLLAAVAAEGFRQLVATIRGMQSQVAAEDALGRFICVGRGYLTFAAQNRSLFRLMFRPELTGPASHPELKDAEKQAFETLWASILECQERGLLSPHQGPAQATLCWSAMHGLTLLWIDNVLAETPLGEIPYDLLAGEMVQLVVEALVSKAHADRARGAPGP